MCGGLEEGVVVHILRMCGGLEKGVVVFKEVWLSSVQCPCRPSRVRISARNLPTVRSEGRQIALLILYK